ncbi:Hsp70 family protein [bacterium]|nr:Hsp70 family protein [bacterium]
MTPQKKVPNNNSLLIVGLWNPDEKTKEEVNDLDFNLTHAEKAKRSLTSKEKALVKVGKEIIEITRDEFNEAISSLILQTKVTVEKTINDSGVEFSDVLEIYMVGGSTRIPLVKDTIASIFNKQPIQSVNPDEVVALGAALYAAIRGDQTKLNPAGQMSIGKIQVKDISNKCFGTVVLNLDYEQVNSTLIFKGDEIPTSFTDTYFILHNLQETVRIQITESVVPEENIDFVRIIWEGDLELSDPKQVLAGDPIEVTYSYDPNQVMQCEFTEKRSGVSKKIQLDMNKFSKSNSTEDIEVI